LFSMYCTCLAISPSDMGGRKEKVSKNLKGRGRGGEGERSQSWVARRGKGEGEWGRGRGWAG